EFLHATAGQVDHANSTLVRALTGIDPDRQPEEHERAMTIDLGFAWLTLPSGHSVSVIDVPGHERFIKNMLAGVGGIDAALLIVAADEGPMPQTVEHLSILDLLQVRRGIAVLTKADTVDDDWLDLVAEETRERLASTTLADAPIVPVSAVTGRGLDELRATLDDVLAANEFQSLTTRPRLPVDRVFSIAGFGTVVTGTLLGGELKLGEELRLFPSERLTRVRGLQTHKSKSDRAQPGSRVAVNLGGVTVDQIRRGDVLAPPNALTPSHRLDVRLRLLPDAPVTLAQNHAVDLFIGAAEVSARVTLLDRETLEPGDDGLVQLRLAEPVAVLKGDRFIVRRASPSETIGGGEVIDAAPVKHRRFRDEVVSALETLEQGSPAEIVLQALSTEPQEVRSLRGGRLSGLSDVQIDEALRSLIADGEVVVLGATAPDVPKPGTVVVAAATWQRLVDRIVDILRRFHDAQPLRRGLPREELKRRLGIASPRLFDEIMATTERLNVTSGDGQMVRLADFRIELDPARRAAADRFLVALRAQPYAPPAPSELAVDVDTIGALVDLGEVVRVGEGVVFAPEAFAAIRREVVDLLERDGSITLAGFRDHFATSRKYAQATLEYLDQLRVTRRVGDVRVRFAGVGASHDEESPA
ncbi:MAG: selenocysteine-specific translation elongation factor, partial [Chloroflexota bacterium]|nr:selenocysteine-specific translation elongation factor [Chloroflexota bacterium]